MNLTNLQNYFCKFFEKLSRFWKTREEFGFICTLNDLLAILLFQVAYLEKLRSDKLRNSCIMIQKNFRCWREHRQYVCMRKAAIIIQAWVRGHLARRYDIIRLFLIWTDLVLLKFCLFLTKLPCSQKLLF